MQKKKDLDGRITRGAVAGSDVKIDVTVSGVGWATMYIFVPPCCPRDTRFLFLGSLILALVSDGIEHELLRLHRDEAVRLSRRSSEHLLLRTSHPWSERNRVGAPAPRQKTAYAAPAAGGASATGRSSHVSSPLRQLGARGPLHSHARRSRRQRF